MENKYVEDVTLAEVKKILIDKGKNAKLNYEQKLAYDHGKMFSKITLSNAIKMKEKLKELELSDELSTKITDILPNEIELNLILEKEKKFDEVKKTEILEIVNKFKKD
jgi:DNA-directed RNA polymerase subunit F